MRNADKIRIFGTETFVLPARRRKEKRFSIRMGDVVRALGMTGRAPAVCSALKSREFLRSNSLLLIEKTGPASGQSTTVTYTYEFIDVDEPASKKDSWRSLRGALSDAFSQLGGGDEYLRTERESFHARQTK